MNVKAAQKVGPTRYRCPKCGCTDLHGEVTIVAVVAQHGEHDAYPEVEDLDLGVGFCDDDHMLCDNEECEYRAESWEFQVEEFR